MKSVIWLTIAAFSCMVAATSGKEAVRTSDGNPALLLCDRAQAKTIESLKNIADGSLYTLDYKADYRLQDVIDASLLSQEDVKDFVLSHLLDPSALKAKAEQMKPSCSAFQAVTPEGDVIYARNYDYRFKDSGTVVLKTDGKNGAYKTLSIASTSYLGLDGHNICDGKTDVSLLVAAPYLQMDGINEKGLAISVLQLSHKAPVQYEEGKKTVMTAVFMRAILDRAANVDEAIEFANSVNFSADGPQEGRKIKSNYHFLVSDATGRTALFEYIMADGPDSDSKWVLNIVPVKAVTNNYLSKGWENVCRGDDRLARIQSRLEETGGVLTEDEAMNLLDTVHQTAKQGHEGKTQWSVIYNLTKKTAKVCVNHDYGHTYTFSL